MAQSMTVQQRNALFAQATRQNIQGMAKKKITQGATTVSFEIPKARLLSKIWLEIDYKFKLKSSTVSSVNTSKLTPYAPIRRISLDLNNGWSPYVLDGKSYAVLAGMRQQSHVVYPQSESEKGFCYCPETLSVSSAGASNTMRTTIELPLCLNDRDPIGIILAQSPETLIEVKVDFEPESSMIPLDDGVTLEVEEITVQPIVETFSIPAVQEAFPDISVVKLCTSRTEMFAGNGQNLIDLVTGTIYRKIAFIIEDLDGNPFSDDDITSNIDLIFNTADVNYSIPAKLIRHKNEMQFGEEQPKGVYIFDFSDNGIPNYGGTRDYIDSTKLTMFQVRFNSNKAGRIRIVSENLARLV